ncbi:type II toxin-antitoxin system toxin DNA ADP-ribosyl transferase DarT [Acinetobacter piscicola]|uniref:type II toxin-antitoxin system toxin DNA ADP-ribosyl transferase DarT n=1 Tax=Acinetobacter piscicola TaxID=2006115 RepID=UPI000B7E0ED3|nr:DUF4433 domain-containing protein [Acinetobacter piscicola]
MTIPLNPDLYHIVHIDKLSSIISNGLLSDSLVSQKQFGGTVIGLNHIKQRRLVDLTFSCYPDLHVGECVPFYFCPRSVMLYMIHQGSSQLAYNDGQSQIIHLRFEMDECIQWAVRSLKRWVFTSTNAGSRFFEDFNNLNDLNKLDWEAILSRYWSSCREYKQAEFLIENLVPWCLVKEIGVKNQVVFNQVTTLLVGQSHRPHVRIQPDWYY